jgi:Flp pilus assembly protein CpaB
MPSTPSKTFRLTVWAILIACLSFIGVKGYIDKRLQDLAGGPPIAVLFAKNPILSGNELDPNDFEVKMLPKKYAHKRSVPAHLKASLGANTCLMALEKGEILLWDHVAQGQRRALSDYLGLSERAISIPVDSLGSLQGMIQAGDRIDIMTVLQSQDLDEEACLKIIVQNALVLSIEGGIISPQKAKQNTSPAHAPKRVLTLRVSPSEAAILAYAQTQGRLFTSLRNRQDVFTTELEPINADYLLQHSYNTSIKPLEKEKRPLIGENISSREISEGTQAMPEQNNLIPADIDLMLK